MTYFYLFIIYSPKLLPRAFGTHRRVFWLLCEVRDVSFLPMSRLDTQKVVIKSSTSSLTFPLKFLFIFSSSFYRYPLLFDTLPKCLSFFPNKTLHFLKGWGTQARAHWIFFFFSSYASLLTSLLRRQGINWFLTSQISRLFFLFLLTPHNRLGPVTVETYWKRPIYPCLLS